MKPYKLHAEDDKSFDIEHDGARFKVAKKGLSKATLAKIQKYAMGGEVKGYDEGGPVNSSHEPAPEPTFSDSLNTKQSELNPTEQILQSIKSARAPVDLSNIQGPDADVDARVNANLIEKMKDEPTAPKYYLEAHPPGTELGNAYMQAKGIAADEAKAAGATKKTKRPDYPEAKGRTPAIGLRPGAGGPRQASPESDYEKKMSGIEAGEEANLQAGADLQAKIAKEKADVANANANAMQAQIVHRQQMEAAYRDTEDAEFKKFKDLTTKYSSTEMDPGKFWASRTTGDKMLAGIGMMLGSVGSALSHTPDETVGIIERAISRDIDAQKHNLETRKGAAAAQQNLLGIMRQRYGDTQAAENATEAAMRMRALAMLDQVSVKYAGQTNQQAVDAAKLQLRSGITENLAKHRADSNDKASQNALRAGQTSLAYAQADKARVAGGSNNLESGLQAIDDLEKKFKAGHFMSPFEYNKAKHNAALTIAQQRNGGKLPREAMVQSIESTLPGWAHLSDDSAKQEFADARKGMRLNVGGGGPDDDAQAESSGFQEAEP